MNEIINFGKHICNKKSALGGKRKVKKKWILWLSLIAGILIVSLGGGYKLIHSTEATKKVAKSVIAVQPHANISSTKLKEAESKASTSKLAQETTTQEQQTMKSKATTESQSIDDLKAFNQKASSEIVYLKYPYGRTMNFERATLQKLKTLEKQYTIKGTTFLKDDYDGQSKPVIVFE